MNIILTSLFFDVFILNRGLGKADDECDCDKENVEVDTVFCNCKEVMKIVFYRNKLFDPDWMQQAYCIAGIKMGQVKIAANGVKAANKG